MVKFRGDLRLVLGGEGIIFQIRCFLVLRIYLYKTTRPIIGRSLHIDKVYLAQWRILEAFKSLWKIIEAFGRLKSHMEPY